MLVETQCDIVGCGDRNEPGGEEREQRERGKKRRAIYIPHYQVAWPTSDDGKEEEGKREETRSRK